MTTSPSPDTLLAELLNLERFFWTEGADFYRANLAGEALLVFPGIDFLNRDMIILGVEGGQRWEDVVIENARLLTPSPGTALLAYAARARRPGEEAPFSALVSSLYVQEAGRWRLAYHHQSPR